MRVLLLSVCIALSACASPTWVNPRNPATDLQADLAGCEKDAARTARLEQNITPVRGCVGAHCAGQEEQQRLQVLAVVVAAQKRCMAQRGWREG